ncbi:MAG: bifunctional phosphopantothenoylcysteine decarboxylase/phosphopantothenate--cysteine ligase CoaBC [Thermoplasmatota archaeon]
MHPADDLRGIKSNKLFQKRIILAVTGSIAAVETIKLARELIRHGAEVFPVMTSTATKIIHPDALEFATSNKPIIELTGKVEHVYYCGLVKKPVDLVLICPCTANTISKIAHGIDDTPVTTFATTAIGSDIPVIVVPAMHLSMYNHKAVEKNIKKCKKLGVTIIEPAISNTKAKMPGIDEIVSNVIRKSTKKHHLADKDILIIGGATAEPIDNIRILTNISSGKTAVSLAISAYEKGANVELWYGHSMEPVPLFINVKSFQTVQDIFDLLKKNKKKFYAVIVCAAIADYIPKKYNGKIPSKKPNLLIECSPAPKVLEEIHKIAPKSKLIAFKAEYNKIAIEKEAEKLLKKYSLYQVIGNTTTAFGSKTNKIVIINRKGEKTVKQGKKELLSEYIINTL